MKKFLILFCCVFGLGFAEILFGQSVLLSDTGFKPENSPEVSLRASGNSESANLPIDRIIELGKTFLNKPYCYKGPSPWKMDCSGYLAYIFSQFGYQLPHSAPAIAAVAKKINQNEIKKGDLLFFKGRNLNKNFIGHVALVIQVKEDGNIMMMHSCRRGIIIDEYQKVSYYTQRFVGAGRLPFMDDMNIDSLVARQNNHPSGKETIQQDSISIVAVGDMMLGTLYPSGHLPPNDGKDLLTPVKDILQNADLTFGNCEGGFMDEDGIAKQCKDSSLCYVFRMPEHYAKYYADAGFDLLSIANNHVGDFGEKGKEHTVAALKKANLHFAGLVSCPYATFEVNGVKYGFCAFAPNDGTVDLRDIENAKKIVAHLDSVSDIVIVSFHGGAEGATHTHVTRQTENFHGEDRGNVYKFAHAVIDAGADVVLGHGPHVTRA
ncbi:MAG TPA: CapA family protein, partial [Bacteroidia bacterium]